LKGRVITAALCAALVGPATAQATDHFNSKPFSNKVTVANILRHEQALQDIANANGGTRVAGSSGNNQTIDYIVNAMKGTGWTVKKQAFEFPYFQELAPGTFARVSPNPATFANGTDFTTMQYSGSGDVTARVTAVGPLNVPIGSTPAGTTISGCSPSDFAGFPVGNIALVQRGSCNFGVKAMNAQTAGASGVVIFNEGQPGRETAVAGTLGGVGFHIPVLGTTYALGADTVQRLRGNQPVTFHVSASTVSETRTTYNVIADSPWGDVNRTVVVSAHNDSVGAGPGINDDGSGTSMDLELARTLGTVGQKPANHVRFLWVGAEEEGLLGSNYYVAHLTAAEKAQIIAMLDFDMVASPNFIRGVYDGDGSTFGDDASGPGGSGYIESLFNSYFDGASLAHEPIPFDGRSDYVAFTNAGIPAGGIFTGAEAEKTPAQQAMYGGTAGAPLDPCYHQACDTFANLNTYVLGQMKDAAADVLYQLALTRNPIADGSQPKPGSGNGHKKAAASRAKHRNANHARATYRGHTAQR
jgi:Zn-dependent M28 family amino/carboxypeptidase